MDSVSKIKLLIKKKKLNLDLVVSNPKIPVCPETHMGIVWTRVWKSRTGITVNSELF